MILCIVLLAGNLPAISAAETEGIFTYSVFNGEATVTGVSSSGGTEVTIPATLGGYPVTAIGSKAFNAAGWVTKVILPEGVTSIAGDAFSHASKLTSVKLPSTLQSIGSYAFSNCYALTDITLPANLTSIGTYAFNQTGLASVSIPAGVTAIADGVFQSCGSLTNVQFHDNVTDIGINAFYNCEKLEVSALPSGLKTIGASAFSGCDALTALVIPDSVTTIGDEAFATCEGLTTVTIGSGAAQIPGNAFRYCAALEAFSVVDGNENFCAQNGILYNKDKTSLICAPKALTGCEIPAGVLEIGPGAFNSCWELSTVTIPEGVTTISASAFRECQKLSSLNIPASVTSIGEYAFIFSGITELTFLGNAPAMNANALYSLESVAKYNLGSSGWEEAITQQYGGTITWTGVCTNHTYDREVAEDAYLKTEATCTSPAIYYKSCACGEEGTETFEHGEINEANHAFDANTHACACGIYGGTCGDNLTWILDKEGTLAISGTGEMENYTYDTIPWYYCRTEVKRVIVGEGVTSIGAEAFNDCMNLTEITLPNGITSIGEGAFANCINLTGITLPNSVTSIGVAAFSSCKSLTSIAIPERMTSLSENLFFNCSSLKSVTIPDSVTSLGDGVFNSCMSLTSVTIPDSVTSIGDSLFISCRGLTSVKFPAGITSIGYYMFADCKSLTSIVLPDSVTSIEEGAFYYCNNLTSITIPSSMNSIGIEAFYDCKSLTSIEFSATAPTFGDDVFSGCQLTAYYPRTATGWTAEVMQPYGGIVTWKAYCQDDAHVFDQQKIDAEYLVTAATCTQKAVYHYSCACGEEGTETFTIGNLDYANHNFVSEVCTHCALPKGLKYSISDGKVTITGYTGSLSKLDIPKIIEGKPVTAIGELAFYESYNLTDVTIPEGVTTIAKSAFDCCFNLSSITIPEGVTSIGDYAFYACEKLTNIDLPETITSIGAVAFGDCKGLTSFVFPKGITNIPGSVLAGCSGLTAVTIPEGVTSIGFDAFWHCISLSSVVIPDSVTSIGGSAFSYCGALTNITIPDRVTSIGDSAFFGCTGLTALIIPSNVTSIAYNAFYDCTNLTSVTFTGDAPTVGDNIFSGCNLTAYYPRTASGWTAEVMRPYGGTVTWKAYCQDDAHTFDQQKLEEQYLVTAATCTKKAVYHYSCACGAEGEETFEYGNVLNHTPDANFKCTACGYIGGACGSNLTWTLDEEGTLTISGEGNMADFNPEEVPWKAYESTIRKVVIEEGVTSIGTNAFVTYENLVSITIPEGFLSFSDNAFANCDRLISVTIPDSVVDIGCDAFVDCNSLTGIWVNENNSAYSNDSYGVLFNKDKTTLLRVPAGISGSYTVPDSVINVEELAFCNCDNLTNVTIPNSVTYIGFSAFSGCERLSSVVLSNNITHISTCMFSECSSLTSVTIPEGVTSIDGFAFRGCTSLESITIPKSVTNIQYRAFADCTSLKTIYFEGDLPPIGDEAFIGVTATAYYPANNTTWTADKLQNYGGTITWKPYCPNDAHVYDQQKAEAQYMVSAATCTKKAVYHFSCACGEKGSETFEYGNTLDHEFNQQKAEEQYLVTAATCTKKAVYHFSCACGEEGSETFEHGSVKPHDYKAAVTAPTCTEKGYTTHTCSACGDSYVDSYVKELGHDLGQWATIKAATCTENGTKRRDCSRCDHFETAVITAPGHSYKTAVTAPTCTEKGYTTHTCSACGNSYADSYVNAKGHTIGQWIVVTEPVPGTDGEDRRDCESCDHYETRATQYQGNALMLEGEDLLSQSVVYINGLPYAVQGEGAHRYVELPTEEDCYMVTYKHHVGDPNDIHTYYPTGMKVYKVEDGKITYIPELDNLLQYSGSSIRITGKKGIRMITSLNKDVKAALTGKGLAGYKLLEYGTALCFASEVAEDGDLVLGQSYTRSNFAYKKGVADPVFADTGKLIQYTNVLVGFSLDQCKDDIAMRPYIILEDVQGQQITLYGGTIYRSIGYIAYQNRKVFQPGNASYDYVWEIIHHVYGKKYDADYKG